MDIFFLKKSEILKTVSNFDNVYKSEKRNIEYNIGRFFTKYIGKNFYNLVNTEITIIDKKPTFIEKLIYFSISHSDEYVAVAFSKNEVGLDVEKFKEKNLEKLSKYFKKIFNSQEEFFKYWTCFEANYKSNLKNSIQKSFKYKDYYVSVSTIEEESKEINFYEALNTTQNTALLEEINLDIKEIKKDKIVAL